MSERRAPTLFPLSPRLAVLHARRVAQEFREFSHGSPNVELSQPLRDENEAYRVLFELFAPRANAAINSWATLGRRIVEAPMAELDELFDELLDEILLRNSRKILRAISKWKTLDGDSVRPGINEPDQRHACEEMTRSKLLTSVPVAGLPDEFRPTARLQAVLSGTASLKEMLFE